LNPKGRAVKKETTRKRKKGSSQELRRIQKENTHNGRNKYRWVRIRRQRERRRREGETRTMCLIWNQIATCYGYSTAELAAEV